MSTTITMPMLRYSVEALEPVISKETIGFHYGKHLQTYVNNLNNLILNTEFADATLEEMAAKGQGGIGNSAGQVLNHSLYFEQFTTNGKAEPFGALADAIVKSFGSLEELKTKMNTAQLPYLVVDGHGSVPTQKVCYAFNRWLMQTTLFATD